jgi:hypothetical protein
MRKTAYKKRNFKKKKEKKIKNINYNTFSKRKRNSPHVIESRFLAKWWKLW